MTYDGGGSEVATVSDDRQWLERTVDSGGSGAIVTVTVCPTSLLLSRGSSHHMSAFLNTGAKVISCQAKGSYLLLRFPFVVSSQLRLN